MSNKECRSEKWVPCQARNDGKEYRISNKEGRMMKQRGLPQHLLKSDLHSLCATFNPPHLPEIRGGGHSVTVIQPDCVLLAHGTAYPTTITPPLVDGNLSG